MDVELRDRDWILHLLKENLETTQNRMKYQADKHRTESSFEVGDMVYLQLQRYQQTTVVVHSNMKFSPRFYGPFKILEKLIQLFMDLICLWDPKFILFFVCPT